MSTDRPSRELLHMIDALLWSQRSLCKRPGGKVGCVITSPDSRITLARGYNGPARGLSHDQCRNVPGQCGCLHAEMNAIALVDSTILNKVMYSTASPCELCAQLIIQANITTLWYLDDYRDPTGMKLAQPFCNFQKMDKQMVLKELCMISHDILRYSETSLSSTLKQTASSGTAAPSAGLTSQTPESLASWIRAKNRSHG